MNMIQRISNNVHAAANFNQLKKSEEHTAALAEQIAKNWPADSNDPKVSIPLSLLSGLNPDYDGDEMFYVPMSSAPKTDSTPRVGVSIAQSEVVALIQSLSSQIDTTAMVTAVDWAAGWSILNKDLSPEESLVLAGILEKIKKVKVNSLMSDLIEFYVNLTPVENQLLMARVTSVNHDDLLATVNSEKMTKAMPDAADLKAALKPLMGLVKVHGFDSLTQELEA